MKSAKKPVTSPKYVLVETKTIKEIFARLDAIQMSTWDAVTESKGTNKLMIEDREMFKNIDVNVKANIDWTKEVHKKMNTTERVIGEAVHNSMTDVILPVAEGLEEMPSDTQVEEKKHFFIFKIYDQLLKKLTPGKKKPTV